jgi:ribosomal protein L39E
MADMITDLAVDRGRLEQVARHNRDVPTGINWTMVLDRYDDVYRNATARHGRSWPLAVRGHPEPVRVGRL